MITVSAARNITSCNIDMWALKRPPAEGDRATSWTVTLILTLHVVQLAASALQKNPRHPESRTACLDSLPFRVQFRTRASIIPTELFPYKNDEVTWHVSSAIH
jgi:hypothetical protein